MSLKLLKSTSIVATMTLLSRISGLVRDVLFANILGDKAAADVFLVAFRIPNFFRRMFGEGAFSAAFVPVFTTLQANYPPHQHEKFLQLMIGRFGLILLVVSLLGVIFAPVLISVLATGFMRDPARYQLAVAATRITFPYIFFISLVAMAAGMLNACGRFAAPAATPVLLNLCLIAAALWLVPQFAAAPIALAIGVLVAGLSQLLFQLPFLRKAQLTIRPRLRTRPDDPIAHDATRRVFRLTLPAILGVSVAQINILINTVLASFLATGSISWLYYSDRLMEFPVGVFGIALATAILPQLARKYNAQSPAAFAKTLDLAVRWALLVCLPATVGLFILAEPLVATVYLHGDFTPAGVTQTARSLAAYAIGMTAIVMVKILAPGFYARQNIKTPVRVAMGAMFCNILFCLLLVSPYQHVGLAMATSIAAFFNAIILLILLIKARVFIPQPGWLVFGLRLLCAAVVMGIVIGMLRGESEAWLASAIAPRVLKLSGIIISGGLAYFAVAWLVGIRPANLWLTADANERDG